MRAGLRLVLAVVAAAALALPLLPLSKYQLHVANLIAVNAILAMGLDLLFGFLGQMSLAHAGFYGVGAYTAALLTLHGVSFWLATPAAMLVCAALGALLGLPAMRLTGFYLAMATMSFGIILSTLFVQSVDLTGGPNGLLDIQPPNFFGTDLIGPVRGVSGNYYYLLLAAGFLVWLVLRRLTTGRPGRVILGVRDSALAAASVGIDVRRVQVEVFALSCAIAGLAGSLYAHLILYISPDTFTFTNSLLVLLAVVFGGAGTLWGPAMGAGLLTVLGEALHSFGAYELIVYAAAICLVILVMPHGVSGLLTVFTVRSRPVPTTSATATLAREANAASAIGDDLFRLEGISKRFGGIQALDAVTLSIRRHEIKALIGPNGSGKTTLFNCATGFLAPDTGGRWMNGRDLTRLSAHRIARAGVARSFQIVQLFGRMTTHDNVVLAGQSRHPVHPAAMLLGLPSSGAADRANSAAADRLIEEAGLTAYRDQAAATLPYGRQRVLEIARALATGPDLLLLDEPAAGLNTGEAFELAAYLKCVRASGVSILIVEHNIPFVLGLADSVAVLNQGRIIADGPPALVQQDEAVVSAYLGSPLADAA